jgi:hypothetical protein
MAARPAARGPGRRRLIGRQHRCRGGAVGGGRARRRHRGRGVPRWPPDLARPRLSAVTAPTLLIAGGRDEVMLDLNRRARAELRCENDLAVVPGASHLFQEPGTLAAAAGLARDWFISHLMHEPGLTRTIAWRPPSSPRRSAPRALLRAGNSRERPRWSRVSAGALIARGDPSPGGPAGPARKYRG